MADDKDTPEVPKVEQERNKEREQLAKESTQDKAKRTEKERAEQQKAAGEDPKDDPKPFSKTGAPSDGLVKTKVGGKEMELTLTEQSQLKAMGTRATAVDSLGVERIVLPTTEPWEPAQVEPDPVEVARLERISKALEAKQEERLAALKGESA